MKNSITIEAGRFPVIIKNSATGEILHDTIILSKKQLQAAQIVGRSFIQRLYQRNGFKVLDIRMVEKKTINVDLAALWEGRRYE